jgi:hypothetical protein
MFSLRCLRLWTPDPSTMSTPSGFLAPAHPCSAPSRYNFLINSLVYFRLAIECYGDGDDEVESSFHRRSSYPEPFCINTIQFTYDSDSLRSRYLITRFKRQCWINLRFRSFVFIWSYCVTYEQFWVICCH